jgi:hypothetical protein
LVSDSKRRTLTGDTSEQGAEQNILADEDELIEGWRKVHNQELHYFHSSPNIIRIKLSRMGWVQHVAHVGRRGMHIGL